MKEPFRFAFEQLNEMETCSVQFYEHPIKNFSLPVVKPKKTIHLPNLYLLNQCVLYLISKYVEIAFLIIYESYKKSRNISTIDQKIFRLYTKRILKPMFKTIHEDQAGPISFLHIPLLHVIDYLNKTDNFNPMKITLKTGLRYLESIETNVFDHLTNTYCLTKHKWYPSYKDKVLLIQDNEGGHICRIGIDSLDLIKYRNDNNEIIRFSVGTISIEKYSAEFLKNFFSEIFTFEYVKKGNGIVMSITDPSNGESIVYFSEFKRFIFEKTPISDPMLLLRFESVFEMVIPFNEYIEAKGSTYWLKEDIVDFSMRDYLRFSYLNRNVELFCFLGEVDLANSKALFRYTHSLLEDRNEAKDAIHWSILALFANCVAIKPCYKLEIKGGHCRMYVYDLKFKEKEKKDATVNLGLHLDFSFKPHTTNLRMNESGDFVPDNSKDADVDFVVSEIRNSLKGVLSTIDSLKMLSVVDFFQITISDLNYTLMYSLSAVETIGIFKAAAGIGSPTTITVAGGGSSDRSIISKDVNGNKVFEMNLSRDGKYNVSLATEETLTARGELIVWKMVNIDPDESKITYGLAKLLIPRDAHIVENHEGFKFRTDHCIVSNIYRLHIYQCINCSKCAVFEFDGLLFCSLCAGVIELRNKDGEKKGPVQTIDFSKCDEIEGARAPYRTFEYKVNQVIHIDDFKPVQSRCDQRGIYFFLRIEDCLNYACKPTLVQKSVVSGPSAEPSAIARDSEKETSEGAVFKDGLRLRKKITAKETGVPEERIEETDPLIKKSDPEKEKCVVQ